MVNQVFIDDKKIKDILTYIQGMRHAPMIRMMFLCSLNGMRSINFTYLQVGDVYTPDLKVKDVICLDKDKNKGKFGCSYYLNTQMKKDPVRMVPLNLKVNGKQFKACTMPYACVDGTMTENGQYINKIAVSGTLTLETPKSLALAPVHMMIGTVSAIKGASIPDIKDLFDKLSGDAQKRHTNTATTVFRGYRIEFSHPKTERIVVTVTKAPAK